MLGATEYLGEGLWYLPRVFFEQKDYITIKRTYRETATQWQLLTPNRLMAMPNNYALLNDMGPKLAGPLSELTGIPGLKCSNVDIFIDLPGHNLSWHFDHDNYKVLLQVYTGDKEITACGTQWYIGDKNPALLEQYGTNSIVPNAGLPRTETPYVPFAGYVNDNTQRKAHGTNKVPPGAVRESVLFTFG
jgi:hypothetical protein